MQKLDIGEIKILDRTLQEQIKLFKSLILDMENAKIDTAYVQTMIDMNKNEIIKIHKKKFKYWQGKNGNWNTYFPKENVEPPYGRLVSKVNRERLDKAIIDYYIKEDKTVIVPTFRQMYEK